MTNNQIQYFKAKEEQRHNLEQENIGRGNIKAAYYSAGAGYAAAAASMAGVAEQRRHNIEMEGINWYSAQNLGALQGSQSSYYGAQSQYISGPQTALTGAQTQYTGAQTVESISRADLNAAQKALTREQAKTESSKRIMMGSQTVSNYVDSATDLIGVFVPWAGN